MNEFILIFRMDTSEEALPSPEQMTIYMQYWDEWIYNIKISGKLIGGNHLSMSGRVLKPNDEIIDGPYAANKDSVAGYIIIKAFAFNIFKKSSL